jgi:rhamnogalacturonyl hydrolase YesR
MMALVDTLDIFNTFLSQTSATTAAYAAVSAGKATLLTQLQTLAPRIVAAADPTSGVWWLVITQPGRAGNYFESSGTAMFVYALLRGVREGYVKDPDGSIVKAMKKAYAYMTANFTKELSNGTMEWEKTVSVSASQCFL